MRASHPLPKRRRERSPHRPENNRRQALPPNTAKTTEADCKRSVEIPRGGGDRPEKISNRKNSIQRFPLEARRIGQLKHFEIRSHMWRGRAAAQPAVHHGGPTVALCVY